MSPNCDEYTWDSHTKCITDFLVFSGNFSDLSSISDISVGAAPLTDGSTYKRRKLHGNTVALSSEENINPKKKKLSPCSCNSHSDDSHCKENKDCLDVAPFIYPKGCSEILFDETSVKASNSVLEKTAKSHAANLNGTCSSSKGNVECSSDFMRMKTTGNDAGQSSDADKKPLEKFPVTEMCISILKSSGLMGGGENPSGGPSELQCLGDPNVPLPCKICGHLGDGLSMLICDRCDNAFHPSCCNPEVKDFSGDEWYCRPCSRKKPKPFLQSSTGKSFAIKDGNHNRKRLPYKDVIRSMLKDTEPYATVVRIGGNFQVEVPEWSGPNSIDHDYFGDPTKMNLETSTEQHEWKSEKMKSVGNWIQCRKVMKTDENNKITFCGKWRRAPLFVQQSDDWDCSCAVIWDPIHADCAVPQELVTSEVRRQLEFGKEVNDRLAAEKLQMVDES